MTFNELHKMNSPLLICNVWDVESAKAAQSLGFKAIATSSGAIASMLGYKDGEEISFKELKYIIERITKSCSTPLTVDLEAGYSRNPRKIVENIKELANLGVVGINIEDSIVDKNRKLQNADTFAKTLEKICLGILHHNIFINVRTDTFLLDVEDAAQMTIERAKIYYAAGGHGLFVPCIEKESDIEKVIKAIDLPLNVMCMPGLPDFSILKKLGVKRISMGNFVYKKVNAVLKDELNTVLLNNSFQNLFA